MLKCFVFVLCLNLLADCNTAGAATLAIDVDTPSFDDAEYEDPTYLIAPASEVGSTLLPAGTAVLLVGIDELEDVVALCQTVLSGQRITHVTTTGINGTEGRGEGKVDVDAATFVTSQNCTGAPNGTEILWMAEDGRMQTIICATDAGCGLWWTGYDVDELLADALLVSVQDDPADAPTSSVDDYDSGASESDLDSEILGRRRLSETSPDDCDCNKPRCQERPYQYNQKVQKSTSADGKDPCNKALKHGTRAIVSGATAAVTLNPLSMISTTTHGVKAALHLTRCTLNIGTNTPVKHALSRLTHKATGGLLGSAHG